MKAFNGHPVTVSYRTWFYLLLTVAVVWDLGSPGLKGVRLFSAAGIQDGSGCQLDSFSEPSIAAAILKRQAERLLQDYIRARDLDAERVSAVRSVSGPTLPGGDQASNLEPGSLAKSPGRAAKHAATQSLECLRRQVLELNIEVDRKLLGIYAENGSWAEFLDRYLEFVREAPENYCVVGWASFALFHSRDCNRTSEVTEALEQVIRAPSNPKVARGLREVLEVWGAGTAPGSGTPDP